MPAKFDEEQTEPFISVQFMEGESGHAGSYYVRKVTLIFLGNEVVAGAILIPWTEYRKNPKSAKETTVGLVKGGLHIPSLSGLNLLLLQGTLILLEESKKHGWFIRKAETLQGRAFHDVLAAEYGPNAKTVDSA